MHFRDLETFLAVAATESVSAAAEQLHLTQPAVTRRIQTMEQRLGSVLFDRVGKRLLLTQAGQLLRPRAQHILAEWSDSTTRLRNLSDDVAGTLHMATSHHIGLHRLAPVLRRFREQYPAVQLNILFEDSEIAHDLVRRGEIELAVATLDPYGPSDLFTHPVWDDPLVFVADPTLIQVPDAAPITLAQLAEMPSVLPGSATYTGRIVQQRFTEAGLTLRANMSTNYLETLGMLVQAGLGWSVLPRSMVPDLSLTALEVVCAPMHRTLGFLLNPERASSNAGQAFIEILQAFATESDTGSDTE